MLETRKNKRGVTLIETILYLGIVVLLMGAFFSYGWDITSADVKSAVVAQTSVAAQDIEQRLVYEIRRAQSVSEVSSTKIVLQQSDEEVTLEAAGGKVTIKRGLGEAVALNSDYVTIDNFVFTHQDSETEPVQTQYIRFSFDAASNYPAASLQSTYDYSISVNSGAAIRTN